jgi:hypothetical protein
MAKINLKMTLIAVAVAALGGGGYLTYSTLNQKQSMIDDQFSKLATSLPPQFKLNKEGGEDGLLHSSAVYKLSFTNPVDKKYNGALVIKLETDHGLSSILNGTVLLKGTTNLDGGIVKALNIKSSDALLSKFEGTIDSDGNLSLKEIGSDIDVVIPVNGHDVTFKAKPFNSELSYSSSTGEINKSIVISEIKGVDNTDSKITYSLKGTEAKYSANIAKLLHGKLGLKISLLEVPSEQIKVEGLIINTSSEEKGKKATVKLDSKINKLNSQKYQDASFETKLSLEGLNKNLFTVFKDIPAIYISKNKVYDHKSFVSGMNEGLVFNVEKFSLKSSLAKIDVSGKYEIVPTAEGKNFSLADQSKLDLSATADSALLGKILGDTPTAAESIQSNNMTIAVNYAERTLKVNQNVVKEDLNNSVIDLLNQLEKDNGLTPAVKDDVKKEEVKVDAPKTEVKLEEAKIDVKAEVKEVKKEDAKTDVKVDSKDMKKEEVKPAKK